MSTKSTRSHSLELSAGPATPVSTRPVVLRTRDELDEARSRLDRGEVAVVMTMGALHEGHAALIRQARDRARHVIVTIFLNPLQFGPGEDLSRYPRTVDADIAICAREGVDVVFTPTPDVVYPDGDPGVRISAGPLGAVLEGQLRPGHFDGVLTVVGKMLHLTRPHAAYFGQKDAQQLAVIRRMTADLGVGVEIRAVDTVREPDGLALSSRNAYLSPEERRRAPSLHRALVARDPGLVEGDVDYLAVVDPDTFAEVERRAGALVIGAARFGSTRLIDNIRIEGR